MDCLLALPLKLVRVMFLKQFNPMSPYSLSLQNFYFLVRFLDTFPLLTRTVSLSSRQSVMLKHWLLMMWTPAIVTSTTTFERATIFLLVSRQTKFSILRVESMEVLLVIRLARRRLRGSGHTSIPLISTGIHPLYTNLLCTMRSLATVVCVLSQRLWIEQTRSPSA